MSIFPQMLVLVCLTFYLVIVLTDTRIQTRMKTWRSGIKKDLYYLFRSWRWPTNSFAFWRLFIPRTFLCFTLHAGFFITSFIFIYINIKKCTRCDNFRSHVPEERQYYGLVLLCFQPRTTQVRGTLAIYVLKFLLAPHDHLKLKVFNAVIYSSWYMCKSDMSWHETYSIINRMHIDVTRRDARGEFWS